MKTNEAIALMLNFGMFVISMISLVVAIIVVSSK
ncbi:putative holin-like toxin [Paenibacillus soyae]